MTKRKKKKIIKLGIPEEFVEKLSLMFGEALSQSIITTLERKPTTFRINNLLSNREEVLSELKMGGFEIEEVSWYRDAFVLKNKSKRELIDTPIYEAGKIYVQSLASMVPPLVLDPKSGERVLDLTAAPGSKTSQIADMMEMIGELVANDNNKIRFFKLKHNMEKMGVVDENDNWQFTLRMEVGSALVYEYPNYFDKILVDAPCSGEARFDRDNYKSYSYWSPRKVKEMAYKQRKLLLSAWSALKPGGVLVYSTCTMSPEEDEEQIARLLERYDDAEIVEINLGSLQRLPILREWQGKSFVDDVQHCLRIKPTETMESFFVVKVRKKLVIEK